MGQQILVNFFYLLGIIFLNFLIYLSSYKEIDETSKNTEELDYIIVGAGTAGITILNGLPSTSKVLLLEAGHHKFTSLLDIPAITPVLHRSSFDWSYQTEKQSSSCFAMKQNSCKWAMGKGYGGSNILNNMIYYRCHPEDFRGWFSNSEMYNYEDEILPYFIENEKILQIEEFNSQTQFSKIFMDNKWNHDEFEFFKPNVTQKNGMRWSVAHHHLLEHRYNGNHKIILNAFVYKILFHDQLNQNDLKIIDNLKENYAYGVEYEKNGLIYRAFSRNGIILSAGTIGTPKILLHSGIGPCDDMKDLKIKCHQNLPVGENLQDHIATGLDLITINTTTAGLSVIDLISLRNLFKFIKSGDGPLTSIGCDILGFQKMNNDNKSPELGFMIIPLGMSTDFGIHLRHNFNIDDKIWDEYFHKLIGTQIISILPILLHPKSHGYVKLSTNNPKDEPKINPKYLTHPNDIKLLIQGIRYIQSFLKNHKLQKLGAKIYEKHFPGCNHHEFDTDDYWECYIRYLTISVYHYSGTCRIGPYNDNRTVVLQDSFQVKNIKNLYVVDASIMPNTPSGNPNSVVMMIARKFLSLFMKNTKSNLDKSTDKKFHEHSEL